MNKSSTQFHLLTALLFCHSAAGRVGRSLISAAIQNGRSPCTTEQFKDHSGCEDRRLPTYVIAIIVVASLLVVVLALCLCPIASVAARVCCPCCLDSILQVNNRDATHTQYAKSSQSLKAKFQELQPQEKPPIQEPITLNGHHRTTLLPNFWAKSDEIVLTFHEDGTLSGTHSSIKEGGEENSKTTVLKGQWCSGSFTWMETNPGTGSVTLAMAYGVYSKNKRNQLVVTGDFCTASQDLGKLSYVSSS